MCKIEGCIICQTSFFKSTFWWGLLTSHQRLFLRTLLGISIPTPPDLQFPSNSSAAAWSLVWVCCDEGRTSALTVTWTSRWRRSHATKPTVVSSRSGDQTVLDDPTTGASATKNGQRFFRVYWLFCLKFLFKLVTFYRATRMHSADYAVARFPSVRPSVTRRYCVYTITQILKVFSPSGSPTIRVFSYQMGWQYSDGNPLNGGIECKGGMKKSRFSTNVSLYLANDTR